jgi:hypothetical protein
MWNLKYVTISDNMTCLQWWSLQMYLCCNKKGKEFEGSQDTGLTIFKEKEMCFSGYQIVCMPCLQLCTQFIGLINMYKYHVHLQIIFKCLSKS